MKITLAQAIDAVQIIVILANKAKEEQANALFLEPPVVKQIIELAERIEGGD